ncbi:S-formylglutathione hydrolase [Neisseriaceae bacterium PsAf]|nr:S-formylglutathione hydrolase [Neisseriaceae bacterium PsAf]MCV2502817.1 S-formylglutathione hydrolase [Neisseriaceae bacterium]
MSTLKLIARHKNFNGFLERYQHDSDTTHSIMTFSIFRPSNANAKQPTPVLYWLSGLTCTDENFATKAGAFEYADALGISVVIPDTSPRGKSVPDHENFALGQGASFYVNATQNPWDFNYQMYDYITKELPQLIDNNFPVTDEKSIMGHSMGGHGALMIGLKNSNQYQSISAFAPIVNPCQTPWGKAAFNTYLGPQADKWEEYDSLSCLSSAARKIPILIHQGLGDEFYPNEVNPEIFVEKAKRLHFPISYCPVKDYDHSYYFISSFIKEHFDFHAKYLK